MTQITQPAYASGTITSDATVPTAADTVTIGKTTYTWRAAVTTTANEVKIGATAAASMQNLFDAINATAAASGVTYGSLTVANAEVTATVVTATVVTVVAKVPGTIGNSIALSESGTHTVASAATLAGGTGSIGGVISQILATGQVNAEIYQILKSLDADSVGN